jgi:4,5-dihydroxyphthalate decarboxylase
VPNLEVTLACIDYLDRTRPLIDGAVETPGVDIIPVPLKPLELTARWAEFDVAEVIFPVYMGLRARGDDRFVAIPVFPYRAFFLSNVVVNVDAAIERPEDLAGKRVGTFGLQLAGTLWSRGLLADEYGLRGSEIEWYCALPPPAEQPDTRVTVVPPNRSLSDLLDRGEIDAWLGPTRPECFERGSPRVRRLFPNYRAVEEDYARRTRIFPIIHGVVLRRDLYEAHPSLAITLVQAFERAKQLGAARLANDGLYAVGLPWLRPDLEELARLFGGDWYPYGLEVNRAVLETMARYAAEQGLTPRRLAVDDLFAPETRGT